MNTSRLSILGVPVDATTYADTLALFGRWIAEGKPRQVCTVNPEFVMRAQNDAAFMQVLQQSALNLPDGQGLLWAARLRGFSLPERVAGSSLTWRIAAAAAQQGWRIYLLGAAPGVAATAADMLRARYPDCQVVGTDPADPTPQDTPGAIGRINAAKPDVLLVAYGAPKQDLWLAEHADKLVVPVLMGVGGSLDFVAGVARRAPPWVQRLGLEWAHRLLQQPRRWRRMLALPRFAWRVATDENALTQLPEEQ